MCRTSTLSSAPSSLDAGIEPMGLFLRRLLLTQMVPPARCDNDDAEDQGRAEQPAHHEKGRYVGHW